MFLCSQIDPDCLQTIWAQADGALPDEACGLLLGRDRSDGRREIVAARPAKNQAAEPTHAFLVAPSALLAAERAARNNGLRVTGVYHSHPRGPLDPSPRDTEEATPEWSHLIVVPAKREFRCYRGLATGELVREELTHLASPKQ